MVLRITKPRVIIDVFNSRRSFFFLKLSSDLIHFDMRIIFIWNMHNNNKKTSRRCVSPDWNCLRFGIHLTFFPSISVYITTLLKQTIFFRAARIFHFIFSPPKAAYLNSREFHRKKNSASCRLRLSTFLATSFSSNFSFDISGTFQFNPRRWKVFNI